ncbi:response regulator [Devosia salina]|uniref:Response regulator n=1 Tax=Devosia salina TaxID=2860336 RepID=A0ABX8WCB6_9HYPH|nr:response regulator [Devosia salina]QYO75077.1 response regulator [Devosia salina]
MDNITVLVVEDEVLVVLELEDALRDAGYSVVTANNGHEGLKLAEELFGSIRGIITDIRVGAGPDGWHIAHRVRELNPQIAVVYMSGDSASDWAANGVPNSHMIHKPFATAQVVTAISQLINEADRQL